MVKRRKAERKPPQPARKNVLVDSALLAQVREVTGLQNNAEIVRVALDHLLSHFPGRVEEEE